MIKANAQKLIFVFLDLIITLAIVLLVKPIPVSIQGQISSVIEITSSK